MILSIESSCDDSSIAVTEISTKKLLFHKKISQDENHNPYGGVVPELASRLHAVALPKILEETREFFPRLRAIAVTNEPGLSVTLMEGVMMAKALALSLELPIIAVNHLKGHIYSLFIEKEASFPRMILLVSGGHTQIIEAESHDVMRIAAQTTDDSFGESFDKVAKMLGLGYPGGPIVEKMAQGGDEGRFSFPVPLFDSPRIAFSYSGLKNAVRVAISKLGDPSDQDKKDLCASFQKAAVEHLLHKTKKVFEIFGPKSFSIVGGASANLYLREKFAGLCEERGIAMSLAQLAYCSDNAAMIGRCAIEEYRMGRFCDPLALRVQPRTHSF